MIEHNYNALQNLKMHNDVREILDAQDNNDYYMECKDGSMYLYLSDGKNHKFTVHRGIEL